MPLIDDDTKMLLTLIPIAIMLFIPLNAFFENMDNYGYGVSENGEEILVKITEEAKGQINDCFVDHLNKVPTDKEVKWIYNNIPRDIKLKAEQWGWWDTEVGDDLYVWMEGYLKENKNRFEGLKKRQPIKEN